jgi:hypothetical protein
VFEWQDGYLFNAGIGALYELPVSHTLPTPVHIADTNTGLLHIHHKRRRHSPLIDQKQEGAF